MWVTVYLSHIASQTAISNHALLSSAHITYVHSNVKGYVNRFMSSKITCYNISLHYTPGLSNTLFRPVCHARKFVTAHLVIVAVFFGTQFFAKLSCSTSLRNLHRELVGKFSFSLVGPELCFLLRTNTAAFSLEPE